MIEGDLTTRELAEIQNTAELMAREWAPCRDGCPVHADVRTYLQFIAEGDWRASIDVVREQLPFAAVCGRVCHHPCEENCRRRDVDEKVAIRELKRFVAETQGADGCTVNKAPVQDKARVAVVGAGPAGMSAALELAKLGYQPTVFEKADVAGGIPATTIPRYRLPLEVVRIDVDWICAHGVEVVTGVEIGKDKTIPQLREEGFAAVVVATGLANSRGLPIPNADHENVYLVLDFLQAISAGNAPKIGNTVLVIGGGNVAMDAARSAVRLGAGTVRAMCLENEEEMPAWSWEQEEARDEGVEFLHRRGPVEIVVDGGKIVGVKARKVTRVFNEQKKFSPEYDDADVIDVACDTVVFAIGQMADLGFIEGSELAADRGRLSCNTATHETSVSGVFACGEIVTPPGSVVEACASGRRCAAAVDQFLSGESIHIDDTTPPVIDTIPEATADKVLKVERVRIPTDPAAKRKTNFEQFEHTLDEAAALREARRCMGCGGGAEVIVDKCAACLTCLRVCPFDIPVVTDVARIESDQCQACGICIAECPANAIVPRSRAVDELVTRTKAALETISDGQKIVAYIGGFRRTADEWRGRSEPIPGVAEVYLASTSRLGVPELLHALEKGAAGVVVVSCPDGTDRYPTTAARTKKRVEQTRELLGEIGLSPEKVQLAEVADKGRDAIREAICEAVVKITEE
ncbi:MAG: FAD-dependent oxidoreductase [Phycisphaerae bacterium]|nr:FAD-dependent oxidoreductase [Phycisphaerae bacterium]